MKLLSLTDYLGFIWALLRLLLSCTGRIARPRDDAVLAGRRPSGTHRLSGRATVGLGVPSRDGCARSFRQLLRRSISGWSSRTGRRSESAPDWFWPRCTIRNRTSPRSKRRPHPADRQVAVQCWYPDLSNWPDLIRLPTQYSVQPASPCARRSISACLGRRPFKHRTAFPATSSSRSWVGRRSTSAIGWCPGLLPPLQERSIPPTPSRRSNSIS